MLNDRHIIEGYVKKDAWGPYDFHRQFNVVFPEQFKLDYSIILDGSGDQVGRTTGNGTRIGLRALYRSYDPDDSQTPAGPSEDGENDYLFMTVFYFTYAF